jgi:hypothetical protein
VLAFVVVLAGAGGFGGGGEPAEEEDVYLGVGVAGEVAGEEEECWEGLKEGWGGEDGGWSGLRGGVGKGLEGWVLERAEVRYESGFAGGLEKGTVAD